MKDAATPSPAAPPTDAAAELPFDAEAFNRRVQQRTDESRKDFSKRTAPNGDSLMPVAIARFMVGCNNPKHEPYLSMIQDLVEAYDAEKAKADSLAAQVTRQRDERQKLAHDLLAEFYAGGYAARAASPEDELFIEGVNAEREHNNRWIKLRCAELGVEWPPMQRAHPGFEDSKTPALAPVGAQTPEEGKKAPENDK